MSRKPLWLAVTGFILVAVPQQASAHDEPVAGSLIGAGIGAMVGGPGGAAVGAVIGAGIGSHVAHETDHGKHAQGHRHYSRAYIERPYRGEVRHVAPAVYCEPEPARYRPKVVYRDKPTRVVHVPSPKARMKKVCRYVPVKHTAAATPARYPAS